MEGSTIQVGRHRLALTNLVKVLYPAGRFTKGQVLDYYARIAPVLLPHFRGRPITLVRYPDGVFQEAFYEKNAPAFTPSWIKTAPVPRSGGGVIRYIVIEDLPTLMWAANLAALELHPFLHRVRALDRPTHVVFDLDPGDGTDLLTCCEVALLIRDLVRKLSLQSFAKVSGSKGIQVYVPLNTPISYEDSHAFARALAELLERQHRRLIVSKMARNLRAGKVFIDWSQNTQSKTTVGAYSLRAKVARPLVSMPVEWGELEIALKSRDPHSLVRGTGVRFSAELPGSPEEIVGVVQRSGLEGVVAKNKNSTYASGARSTAWQKLKFGLAQEFVIGGYNPEGKTFSSMLVGYYSGRRLMFAGKVRQGLTPGLRAKLMKAFAPLATDRCPFVNLPISKTGHFGEGITREDMATLRWLRPKLVAQVSFTEWTSYGLLRHATFLALREDKRPSEVVREEVRG